MKTIGLTLLSSVFSLQVLAQNWNTHTYTADKFPFSVNFPATPEKKIDVRTQDTMLTLTSTAEGTTYALIATRTKSEKTAATSAEKATDKILAKAKKSDTKQTSVIAGQNSTYCKYVSQKDAYVINHSFSKGAILYKAMVLKMKGYASDADAQRFFNSIVLYNQNTSPVSTTTNYTNTTNNTATNNTITTGSYMAGDRVDIYDPKEKKWYAGIILKTITESNYRVAYDGYAETYDEDVTADRIRPMTTSTTMNIPYIKIKKGTTVTLQGNLKNGAIVEDLEWATTSQMACWPSIRDIEFQGNHVAYWFDLPKKSIVKITVTPKSSKTRINIYGYSGIDYKHLIPNIISCTTCEASHPTWIGQPNLNEPAQPQTIEFNATTRHTSVYFAVAGAQNVLEGDYEITIEIK